MRSALCPLLFSIAALAACPIGRAQPEAAFAFEAASVKLDTGFAQPARPLQELVDRLPCQCEIIDRLTSREPQAVERSFPGIFTALPKQLGLKLERCKGRRRSKVILFQVAVAETPVAARSVSKLPWAIAGVLLVSAAGLALVHFREAAPEAVAQINQMPLGVNCVSPGGQRFLVAMPTEDAAPEPLTLVQNWTAALKK
jgi:hypothetical protein